MDAASFKMTYQGRQPDSYGRGRHIRGGGRDGRHGRGGGGGRGGTAPRSESQGMNHVNAPGPAAYTPGRRSTYRQKRARTQTDNRGKRRKVVKGGRIPKKQKPRVVEGVEDDHYCESCCTPFPCKTSYNAHIVSKKHKRRWAEWKEEMRAELEEERLIEEEEDAARAAYEAEDGEMADEDEEVDREAQLKKREEERMAREKRRVQPTMKFADAEKIAKQISQDPQAKSFQNWCSRSIAAARRAGNHPGPVHRECVFTYAFHKDRGTLMITTWNSQKLADGKRYANEEPEALVEMVFTQEDVEKMLKDASLLEEAKQASLQESRAPNGPAPTAAPTRDDAIDVDNISVGAPEMLLKPTKISWAMSSAAQTLVKYHATEDSVRNMGAIGWFYDRHKNITKKAPDSLAPSARVAELERRKLQAKLAEYQSIKESCEYDTEVFIATLNAFVAELEMQGGMRRMARDTLFLIVQVALESGDIDEHHQATCMALQKIMAQFQAMEHTQEENLSEFIAHYLVALLFKRTENENDNEPTSIATAPYKHGYHLDFLLKAIPSFFYETKGFKYGTQLLRAVLHGNHVRFMNMLRLHPIHSQNEGRSGYMLEPIQDFVRQRAFLLLGKNAPATKCRVFKLKYTLETVMDQLNFFEIEDDDNDDEDNMADNGQKKVWLREEAIEHCKTAGLELKPDDTGHQCIVGIPEDTRTEFNSVIDVRAACAFLHAKNRVALCPPLITEEE